MKKLTFIKSTDQFCHWRSQEEVNYLKISVSSPLCFWVINRLLFFFISFFDSFIAFIFTEADK